MIIGLCGGISAGKDTTYLRAQSLYSKILPVVRIGYADKMKDSVSKLFGVSLNFIETEKRNPKTTVTLSHEVNGLSRNLTMTFREFLQKYGTEAHRGPFGDMFWVDAALPQNFDHSDKLVFVTDVRFKSEMQRIVDLGGFNILITNEFSGTATENLHSSENSIAMDLVSYTINNAVRDDEYKNLDHQISKILDNELKLLSMGV